MAYNEKAFVSGSALTNAYATYYTVPSTVLKSIVKEIVVCNTSTNPETFTMNIIPSAGAPAVANTEFNAITLQPNETKIFGRTRVMNIGDFIQAKCSTGAVMSLDISGVERT